MPPLIYLDANIFIYALVNDGSLTAAARSLIGELGNETQAISSVITYGEVLKPGVSVKRNQPATDFIDSLSMLRLVAVDVAIAKQAGTLRLDHNISLPDALHLATALTCGAQLFVTNDLPLAKRVRKLLPVRTLSPLA